MQFFRLPLSIRLWGFHINAPKGAKKRRFTMTNYKVLISNNAAALAAAAPTHTVEAEYGLDVVEGSVLTLAHHGPRVGNPCPCLGDNIPLEGNAPVVIGVSHFDLDTLGGAMRVLGIKEYDPEEGEDLFWAVAAQIDIRGVHHLKDITEGLKPAFDWSDMDQLTQGKYFWDCGVTDLKDSLKAFWAWSEAHRLFAPRDGSVMDCTEFFEEALRVLQLILEGNDLDAEYSVLSFRAKEWVEAKEKLDVISERAAWGGDVVLLREADCFVNHLYVNVGRVFQALVGFNPKVGSVTLSLADPIEGVNCCAIAQQLWGKEAGGHAGIAGSPRGEVFTLADAQWAGDALYAAIKAAKEVQHG